MSMALASVCSIIMPIKLLGKASTTAWRSIRTWWRAGARLQCCRTILAQAFAAALDAGRFFLYDGILQVEDGVPDAARAGLSIKGHQVVESDDSWGGGQGIVIDWDRGTLHGGSDPRKDGHAAGY